MIKSSRQRKFDRCTGNCKGMSRGNYCNRCDQSVCLDCATVHIADHRAADKEIARSTLPSQAW